MNGFIDIDRWEEILITITRNKTRSVLTAFGVSWGIFMLILLLGGGNGLQKFMSDNFRGVVSNSCVIVSQRTSEAYKGFRKGRYWRLSIDDIDILKAKIPEIDHILPVLLSNWNENNTIYEDKAYSAGIKGVIPSYDKLEEQEITYGRFINDIDIKEQRKVCCIAPRIYETLFKKGENPVGKYIRVDGIYYQVIGVVKSGGNFSIGGNAEETILLPFSTMQTTYKYGKNIDLIGITAKPDIPITLIQEKAEAILKEVHMVAPQDAQAIMTINVEKMFNQFKNLSLGVSLLIWIVGLSTLLAGIIGVSNIMMITVKERTAEIGIRRAIGAKPKNILWQILSESLVITLLAGLTAISFSVFILQVAEVVLESELQITLQNAIGTTLILVSLGSLAGLAPAFRAMKVKPIEAIREE